MALGGFYKGFYVKKGTTTFNSSGCYVVPDNYNCIVATVFPGNPGNPSNPTNNCIPGIPGGGGNPSTFKGAATTTYLRRTSQLVPRTIVSVVIGTGGNGGPAVGSCEGACSNPGNPGTPGKVCVVVS